MSGHNKWSQIKHRKGAQDIKRNKVFTKISKEITVAIKTGGEDPSSNFRLRSALEWAKSENMPSDNVNRLIKRVTKQDTEDLEQVFYEGYAAGNIAVMIECLTDNTNRTFTNLKTIFNKNGGNLAQINSVRHLFKPASFFELSKAELSKDIDEESLLSIALDAGADDITGDEEFFYIIAAAQKMNQIYKFLQAQNIAIAKSELVMIPVTKNLITDKNLAIKVLKLIQIIEDEDDVQKVYTNLDIDDELLEKVSSDL